MAGVPPALTPLSCGTLSLASLHLLQSTLPAVPTTAPHVAERILELYAKAQELASAQGHTGSGRSTSSTRARPGSPSMSAFAARQRGQLGTRVHELEGKVARASSENSKLLHEKMALEKALRRSLEDDVDASQRLQEVNQQLADRVSSLKSHCADYMELVTSSSGELQETQSLMIDKIAELQSEVDELESTVVVLNERCAELSEELSNQPDLNRELALKLAAAQAELEKANAQLVQRQSEFNLRVTQLEASKSQLGARQGAMASTMSSLVDQLETMESRCAELSSELETARLEREQFVRQLQGGVGSDAAAAFKRPVKRSFRSRGVNTTMVLIANTGGVPEVARAASRKNLHRSPTNSQLPAAEDRPQWRT